MERYTFEEVKELLNFKKDISALKWCSKNGVTVAKQGNARFVLQKQFDMAYYEPVIRDLKALHGDLWMSYFQAYRAGEHEPQSGSLADIKDSEIDFLNAS